MTSNLGSDMILESAAGQEKELREKLDALLKSHFRPEFLNRIDEIVMFNRLGKEHIESIVRLQLERVAKRLEDRRISIEFTDDAVAYIADKGYNPSFGARPVKRAVQSFVENPLSKKLLEGSFADGASIKVTVVDGELAFS